VESGPFPFCNRHTFNRLHLLIRQMAVRVCGHMDGKAPIWNGNGRGTESPLMPFAIPFQRVIVSLLVAT